MSLLHVLPLAHALVARKDLPIPAWLFAWGASIVLIVSFFALSAAWREPRFEEEHWRPLGGGALAGPARPARADPLRGDRRLPARGLDLRRAARHRSARSQLRDHLPLRHRLARLPAVQRRLRQRLQAVQPLAGDRPGRRAAPSEAIAGQRSAHLRLPGGARPLAGGDRPGRLRLAGDRLRHQRRRRGRPRAPRGRRRRPRLQRLHAGDDGPLRGRGVVRAGRDLLGLLRDVLAARLPRRQRRAGSAGAGRSRRRPSGRRCPARRRS